MKGAMEAQCEGVCSATGHPIKKGDKIRYAKGKGIVLVEPEEAPKATLNLYEVRTPFGTVPDYKRMLRGVVVVARDEAHARLQVAMGRLCSDECSTPVYSKQHTKMCFWATSPEVTVTLLGTAAPGMTPRIVMLQEERSDNED